MIEWTQPLVALLASERWEVMNSPSDPALSAFVLVAENPVAVLFVARSDAASLKADAQTNGAAIGAYLHARGGPKVWEGYLVLLAESYGQLTHDELSNVQRDLTYCRKIVIDAQVLRLTTDPEAWLRDELAMLFPLRLERPDDLVSVPALLQDELVGRGVDPQTASDLIMSASDPSFNAIEYLAGARHGESSEAK